MDKEPEAMTDEKVETPNTRKLERKADKNQKAGMPEDLLRGLRGGPRVLGAALTMMSAADYIEALRAELERVRGERDEAIRREQAADVQMDAIRHRATTAEAERDELKARLHGEHDAHMDCHKKLEKARENEGRLHGPWSHWREPHCCGCWIISVEDGEPVAKCNECDLTLDLLKLMEEHTMHLSQDVSMPFSGSMEKKS